MLLFTSSLATWEIILSWRLSALPGFIQSQSPTKDILALVGRFSTPTTFRQNWLDDTHLIGRLLKPHLTHTIFINFVARKQLISERASASQLMFSVFPSLGKVSEAFLQNPSFKGPSPPPLLRDSVKRFLTSSLRSFHTEEIFTTPWKVGVEGAMRLMEMEMQSRYSWPSESFPTKMEERGFHRNKSDGLEGFYYRYFYVGHHSMRWRGSNGKDQSFRCNPKDHFFLTGMTVFDSGTPCIVMLRGLSSLPIHLTR